MTRIIFIATGATLGTGFPDIKDLTSASQPGKISALTVDSFTLFLTNRRSGINFTIRACVIGLAYFDFLSLHYGND